MYTKTSRQSRGGSTRSGRSTSYNGASSRGRFHGSRPQRSGGGRSSTRNRPNYQSGKQNRGGGKRKMASFNPSQFINKNPVDVVKEVYTPKNSFDTMGLNNRLAGNLNSMGLKSPSPIQDQIIPEVLAGRDVIGLAETGTGKTAAFLIPLINKNLQDPSRQTLILAPTRELAIQIGDELHKIAKGFRIFSAICVGGISIHPQIKALRRKNQFIIGTPGRVLDLIKRKHFMTSGIKTVVLDEADRMLDMGFIDDMRKILSSVSKNRETLLFSATMNSDAKKIVHDFLKNPVTVSVKKSDVTNSIEQDVVRYNNQNKFDELVALLSNPELKRVLIFGSMKHSVQKLAQQLSRNGMTAESIHGNKSHGQRQIALAKFKNGQVRILVATDVAARGIHVNNVSHVINYDMPNTFEDYVHRIGRTGRAAEKGKALTFIPASITR